MLVVVQAKAHCGPFLTNRGSTLSHAVLAGQFVFLVVFACFMYGRLLICVFYYLCTYSSKHKNGLNGSARNRVSDRFICSTGVQEWALNHVEMKREFYMYIMTSLCW